MFNPQSNLIIYYIRFEDKREKNELDTKNCETNEKLHERDLAITKNSNYNF